MSTIYFTGSSLDGFIVDEHGSLEWLMSRDVDAGGPYGYDAFMRSVGALVLGATTYEWPAGHAPWAGLLSCHRELPLRNR